MHPFVRRPLLIALLGGLSACAMVPSPRPGGGGAVDGLSWLHRPAGQGEGEAALWGPAQSTAILMIQCTRAGAELVVEGDARPTAPWRLVVGRESMALDPMYAMDAIPTETATIPRDHPLLAALAASGGPMRLSTRAGAMTIPGDAVVARVAGACRR